MSPQTTQIAITATVIIIVLGFRLRRMSQMRPLRLEQLWIVPAIYFVLFALTLSRAMPIGQDWLWIAAAAAVGGALGWYRGKMMQIHVDPTTHALNQKASPAGMILILAIIGIRVALNTEVASLGVPLNRLTDASLAFVVAMFTMVRVEMFIRAQRLLAEAKASSGPTNIVS